MALNDLTQDQRKLAEMISRLSERRYRAGWMSGIEFEVWQAVHGTATNRAAFLLTAVEVDDLIQLSARCAGWIVFDEHREETFVAATEWLARLNAAKG